MKRWWMCGTAVLLAACAQESPEVETTAEAPSMRSAEAGQEFAAEIVGPGVVSDERNQTFPAEDPLEAVLWYSVYDDGFDDQTIMYARQTVDGYAEPQVAPFSGEWGDRAPRFSPGGAELYFTSNRPRSAGAEAGLMNVWRVRRAADGVWSEPELVEAPVSSDDRDIHPSVTESAFWIPSYREGTLGRADIFRVSIDGTSTEHLPGPINTELSQPDLYVSPDESWMILVVTNHPDGYGGDDLFVSRREGDGWSEPVNLGPAVNTEEYEYGPTVSRDGRFLLFTSHKDGPGNTYRIALETLGLPPGS